MEPPQAGPCYPWLAGILHVTKAPVSSLEGRIRIATGASRAPTATSSRGMLSPNQTPQKGIPERSERVLTDLLARRDTLMPTSREGREFLDFSAGKKFYAVGRRVSCLLHSSFLRRHHRGHAVHTAGTRLERSSRYSNRTRAHDTPFHGVSERHTAVNGKAWFVVVYRANNILRRAFGLFRGYHGAATRHDWRPATSSYC